MFYKVSECLSEKNLVGSVMTEKERVIPVNFEGGKKWVNKMDHLVVFGFVREHQNEFEDQIIPSPIFVLCLMYYFISDFLGKHSPNIRVFGDNKESMTSTTEQRGYAYGYDWFHSKSNKLITYRIEVKKLNVFASVSIIGITSKDTFIYEDIVGRYNNIFYALFNDGDTISHSSNGCVGNKDMEYQQGDIVTMKVNFVKGTVSWYVNEESRIASFENIEQTEDRKYKLFIQIWNEGDSFTVLECTEEVFA